jgi:hypothetical protein
MKLRQFIFSRTSKVIHSIWFAAWFILRLDINLLTLIVSLEAIYLELFLGDNDDDLDGKLDTHHSAIKRHINKLREGK